MTTVELERHVRKLAQIRKDLQAVAREFNDEEEFDVETRTEIRELAQEAEDAIVELQKCLKQVRT